MTADSKSLAIVTGASRGIGYELAKLCAKDGHDLIIAAQRSPALEAAAAELREMGASVETIAADLAEVDEIDKLLELVRGRDISMLMANAGHGLGHAFLDQEFRDIRHLIDTNITGTVYLLHRVGRIMRTQGHGKILITGSIAGVAPAPFHAVYHASKAFVDNFSASLRNELADVGITVTCLMPGATDTDFFARADLLDTKMAQSAMADPADVAKTGYDALLRNDGEVVHGLLNKLQVATAHVTPNAVLAKQFREGYKPGSAAE